MSVYVKAHITCDVRKCKAKLQIGLGDPYRSPTAMQALRAGIVDAKWQTEYRHGQHWYFCPDHTEENK